MSDLQQYVNIRFRADTLNLIETMNKIIDSYILQGFRLTVRQLYYQLVARAIIENTEKSYKRITGIVNDARLAGIMDWEAIEDRTRDFVRRTRWLSGKEILTQCAKSYHMDMWDNQRARVFVIVEKEALVGVLERVCHKYDVPLLAARGYPSGTVLREFAQTDLIPAINRGHDVYILHLGDHDPSGIDMSRDLAERLSMFAETHVSLDRIALTMGQIKSQSPPPNPAKSEDSRFEDYRKKFGWDSWELDALTPSFLENLVEGEITNYIDDRQWDIRAEEIDAVRKQIEDAAESF